MFFLLGLMSSVPEYFRKFHPRKSKPSSMCTSLVLALDSRNPLTARNASIHGLISVSSNSFDPLVTTKSSAYRTTPTLSLPAFDLPNFAPRCAISSVSSPFNVQFARAGLMMPPCGVPAVVAINCFRSITPDFSHLDRIDLSMKTLSTSH
ncbi:hypothetical protein D3C72_1133060 [compost metagenome]